MTAQRLRDAARGMREKAEGATPGPWLVPGPDDEYMGPFDVVSDGEPGARYIICEHAGMDAPYIAAMHPAVALAVAGLLEAAEEYFGHDTLMDNAALAIADAFLGQAEGDQA